MALHHSRRLLGGARWTALDACNQVMQDLGLLVTPGFAAGRGSLRLADAGEVDRGLMRQVG